MEFRVYKGGQGRYVRVGTAIGSALVAMVLAYYVYVLLNRHAADDFAYKVYLEYAIPAGLFVVLCAVTAFLLNKPSFVDFLIATESEMKKVSWSSRAELLGSSAVVIVTVFLLALFIFVVDFLVTGGLSGGWNVPFTDVRLPGLGLW